MALMLNSCVPVEDPDFDSTMLVGKWHDGTLFERYESDGNGATWDTSDDITEEEAQVFTWTLNGATLIQNHVLFNGVVTPKTYTVTTLNGSTFSYQDDYGVSHSFVRVD
jgi:hypothetical protein